MTRYEKDRLLQTLQKLYTEVTDQKVKAKDRYDHYTQVKKGAMAAQARREIDYRIGQQDILKVIEEVIKNA